jgi:hypothetical protein
VRNLTTLRRPGLEAGTAFFECAPRSGPRLYGKGGRSKGSSDWKRVAPRRRIPPGKVFPRFRERIARESRFGQCRAMGSLLRRVGAMIRKEYEYRINAIRSLELARRTACPADKAHLLKLAEDWLDLANLTHRQSGRRVRKIGEHPIIRAKLGTRDQRAA